MDLVVNNKNKKNNSSNSLVFGLWPQTKTGFFRLFVNPTVAEIGALTSSEAITFKSVTNRWLTSLIPD